MHFTAFVAVLFDGVYDVERALAFYVACRCRLSEGDAVHDDGRFRVYELQFDVLLMASYHLAGAVVEDVTRQEQRLAVARAMGGQSLQFAEQSLVNLMKVQLLVDVQRLLSLFGQYVVADILLKTPENGGETQEYSPDAASAPQHMYDHRSSPAGRDTT